ncbi:hypothetical protein Tco_1562205 [Tanacetum coccineum]
MAEENVPSSIRTDEQLVPVKARLPIGKCNHLMDLQKIQKNPIFCLSVDILQNTNFFSAFTTSVDVPSIYIHALGITPKDFAHPFVAPTAGDLVIDFVNNLGYPEELQFVSKMGVISGTNIDYAELIWEEFVQAIKTFFTDPANLKVPTKKPKPHMTIHSAILNSSPKENWMRVLLEYLDMASCKPHQATTVTDEEGGKKKKAPPVGKSKKPAPAKQPALAKQTKPVKEKTSKPSPSKKIHKGKVMKVHKGKTSDHLVDEKDEEPQPASEPQVEDDEYNLQRGIQISMESFQAPVDRVAIREPVSWITRQLPVVEGKGKGIATDEQTLVTQDESTRPSAQPQDDTFTNMVYDTPSPADAETGEDVSNMVALEERTVELDEGQAGSDPGWINGQSHVVQAGPNPEPMYKDFVATGYPQVHESLKLTMEEHVHIENLSSSSRTLSSMKNLDDAFTFGDQFLNDKPTKEEPSKANVEIEVESIVTVPIHQASLSVPLLSTPIIDLTPPKPVSPPAQEPIFTATTATTTTLPLPPPLPQQSTIVPELATCVDKYVNEVVKEAVQNTLQALIHERFRDLSEFEMKEILRDRMFESGSYRSHTKHTTLYEALEASMDHENREEFNEEMAKSRKRRHDDQDPPLPPPKDSDRNKKKKHNFDASASKYMPSNDVHLSNSKDTSPVHLLKIKTRPDWLKPLPEEEEEAPEKPEPDWVIPPNDLPETENNWADALAKTYKDPKENKLLRKTRDMGSFINWYCKQIRKSKLVEADLEGPAYKLVKPFHKNNISLQFQMEECHLLLTDQINLMDPEGNRDIHEISKPLPLGGPPGQVTIQTQYFFNKDLEYLVSGDKERRNALSISKLKVPYNPDFGLEEINEFYITRHNAPSNSSAVRSYMKILSVVSLKTFSRCGYTYLKEIVLRIADYKEYKISEADFKNLHSNNFEDMNIVIRQHVEDLQLRIECYQMQLNLTQPRRDATNFLFKEDYTIVHKPRAVIYKNRNNQKKMMRETEMHKFSDGTLMRILEKLDFMVKDYELFKFNPGM